MIDMSGLLSNVPEYRRYMTIEELDASSERLAKEYPSTVRLFDLGNSAGGRRIKCLKIGNGKHNVLIYGFPNPEEPVGGLLIDYFSRSLAENESLARQFDYTWYLIKCIDPDGARLNEGYLEGPLTLLHFAENYYRSPAHLTGEENFPYRYGDLDFSNPVPETRALMNVMNEISFDFISSLHNMKWGGITYQVSEACPQLYAPLQQLARIYNIPPRKRQGSVLASGVQLAAYFTPVRNYVNAKMAGKGLLEEITGAFVFEYAALSNPQVFMMVPECCTWYDVRCWDDRPSDTSMAEVVKYASHVGSETNMFLLSIFDKAEPLLTSPSPFLEMIRSIVKEIRSPTVSVLDPGPSISEKELERPATIAEKVETEGRADVYRMFNLGAMIRMLGHQIAQKGDGRSTLESCKAEAMAKLEEWNRIVEEKYECKHHPLRNLVALNLGSILYSTEYVKWKKTWKQ